MAKYDLLATLKGQSGCDQTTMAGILICLMVLLPKVRWFEWGHTQIEGGTHVSFSGLDEGSFGPGL